MEAVPVVQVSNSWTGGFIRLTRVLQDGGDGMNWIRAAAIFDIMVSDAKFVMIGQPDRHMLVTVVTAGYQGVMYEMCVKETPDQIMALIEAVLNQGAIAATDETI